MRAWKVALTSFFAVYAALNLKYFLSHPEIPLIGKLSHLGLKIQALPWMPWFIHHLVPRVACFDDGWVRSQDVTFDGEEGHVYEARLFIPRNESNIADLFVWIHGGGFVLGDPRERHIDETCRLLTRLTGIRFIALNYRKAPKHHYLTGFVDIAALFEWLRDEMPHVKRIGLGGDSAGATLSLSAAVYHPYKLQHLLLVYPGLHHGEDLTMVDAWILPADVRAMFKAHIKPPEDKEQEERYHFFRELLADLDDDAHDHLLQRLPKTHIISAGKDPLHPSSSRLETKMRAAQCLVEHTLFADAVHGFFCQPFPERPAALSAAADAIRRSFAD